MDDVTHGTPSVTPSIRPHERDDVRERIARAIEPTAFVEETVRLRRVSPEATATFRNRAYLRADAILAEIQRTHAIVPIQALPLDKWHEDVGDVMWVKFPIDEPPYVGTPNDMGQPFEVELRCVDGGAEVVHKHTVGGWPGYHTHWLPLPDMNRVVPASPPQPPTRAGGENE